MHLAIRSSSLVESPAARLLGAEHPLTRAFDRRASLHVEIAVLGAVLVGSLAALARRANAALAVVLAAGVVGALAALRLMVVRAEVRSLVLDLIVEGRGRLPLAEVQKHHERLLDARHCGEVAQWLENIAVGRDLGFGSPSLISARVAAGARRELREVAGALSRGERGVAGVALLEELATEPWSPLYGDDVRALRETLARVRFLLAS